MPKPTGGIHRVKVYNHGSRYQTTTHGFGLKWHFPQVVKNHELACEHIDATGLDLIAPGHRIDYVPAASVVNLPQGLGGVTSTPLFDASQDIGLSYYETNGGSWEAISDGEYAGSMIFQRDATENQRVTCRSRFRLPANPWLVFNLWRGEPSEDQDRTATPPFTAIRFGTDAGQFALFIPYGEPAYVAYWSVKQSSWLRVEAEDNGKLPAMDGLGKGERVWIQIAFWRQRLCVSIGRGVDSNATWATFPVPQEDVVAWDEADASFPYLVNVPFVQAGPFEIEHTGGQIAFRWWPINHDDGEVAVAWTKKFDAGYPLYFWTPAAGRLTASNFTWYAQRPLQQHALDGMFIDRYDPINNVTLTVLRPDSNPSENDTTFSWELAWTATHWTLKNDTWPDSTATGSGSAGYIDYYQAPTIHALFCKCDPLIEDNTDWPTATDISANVQAISISVPEGSGAAIAGLKLRNTAGASKTIRDGQLATIELGYSWDDGSNDLTANRYAFTGYVVSPARGAKVGPLENCDVVLFDPMVRLRDEKAHYCPDFQLDSPVDAVTWLFKRAGFHADQLSIEGSSEPMFSGQADKYADTPDVLEIRPESDALMPAFGSELVRSVEEYAKRDNESLVYCKPDWTYLFKAYKTNGKLGASDGTLWTIAEDADWSAKTQYRIYDIAGVERVAVDSDQYADLVIVRGRDAKDRAVTAMYGSPARWTDTTDADYSGGWRHMHCIERDHIADQAAAQALAAEKFAELGRRAEVITFTTDVLPGLSRGDRIELTNTAASGVLENAGVRSSTFRVMRFDHVWNGPGQRPMTTITARSLET